MNWADRLNKVAPKVMGLKDRFPKGQYQGRTVEYVLFENPKYLCYVNEGGYYKIDETIIEQAEQKVILQKPVPKVQWF